MGDTKKGREKQARNAENRQRERELQQERDRGDEPEPPHDDPEEGAAESDDVETDSSHQCHRRGCADPPAFAVLERYQEETGHGAVEAEALLCPEHTADESPANLDGAYADYVFRVEPLPEPDRASDT